MFKKTPTLALMAISANAIDLQANDISSCFAKIKHGSYFDYLRELNNCSSCGIPVSCSIIPPSDGGVRTSTLPWKKFAKGAKKGYKLWKKFKKW